MFLCGCGLDFVLSATFLFDGILALCLQLLKFPIYTKPMHSLAVLKKMARNFLKLFEVSLLLWRRARESIGFV
jgi:hypothetical protein